MRSPGAEATGWGGNRPAGMMTILQLLEAAWEHSGATRNELMRALPTELARKLAANPRFRQAPASSLIIVGVRPRQ